MAELIEIQKFGKVFKRLRIMVKFITTGLFRGNRFAEARW